MLPTSQLASEENMTQTPAETSQQPFVQAANQPLAATQQKMIGDIFSRISDDLLGVILRFVASNGNEFDSIDSLANTEDILQKKIEDALRKPLPCESQRLGTTKVPPSETCSLVAFSHALVCNRWLRVASSVHPAIIVPRNRFFSSRAFASLLAPPKSRFSNLSHLHLGEFALDSIDSNLVRSICTGCGSTLTHLTMHLYDRRFSRSTQHSSSGRHGQSTSLAPSDVAAIFESCSRLVNLQLDGVQEIPASISRLQQLTRLSVKLSEGVTGLPEEFGRLVGLQDLQFQSGRSLSTSPDPICYLSSLERLTFSGSHIFHLPSNLGQLRNLKFISLMFLEEVSELPVSICELSSLMHLSLSHCPQLTRLPENLHQLPNLDTLELIGLMALTALPESIDQLPALQEIYIHTCPLLTQLPDSLSASQSLRRLTVDNCLDMASLPDDIGLIDTLQYLHLDALDELNVLRDSVGLLSGLKELKVVDCPHLECFPESVSAMGSLTSLVLDCCAVCELPEDIGQLQSLTLLKLSCAWILALPESFGQLGKLRELMLHACYELTDLPDSFSNLSSLECLEIYGGTCIEMPPVGFEQLLQLRRLELFNCSITELPEDFGDLANLKEFKIGTRDTYTRRGFDVDIFLTSGPRNPEAEVASESALSGSCALRALPHSLVNLPRLELLIIDGCEELVELPIGMGNLSSLTALEVMNCENLRVFPSLLARVDPGPSVAAAAAAAATVTAAPAAAVAAAAAATACSSGADPCPSASYIPLPSLQRLKISGCPKLECLPEGLDLLPRLEDFTLADCKNLRLADQTVWLPTVPVDPLPLSAPISLPRSLTSISISDTFERARYLPESFLSLSRLTSLKIQGLQSLQQLIAPLSLHQNPSKRKGEAAPHVPPENSSPMLPESIRQARLELLSSLTFLHISNTRLPSLPDNLSDLRGLKVLVLEECPAMPLLPACLSDLSNLERLSIKTLPLLTNLPENLGQLKVLSLHLESCKELQGLPASLTLMTSLICLSIVDCSRITSLPDSISSLFHLASLKLNHLPGLNLLPPTLPLLSSLVKLSLRECTGLRALPSNLGSLSCLREVDLDGCLQLEVLPQLLMERQNVVEVKGSWGSAGN